MIWKVTMHWRKKYLYIRWAHIIYKYIYKYTVHISYIGSFWFDMTVWISVAPVVRVADCDGGGVPKTSELVHVVLAQQEETADWIQAITKVCLGRLGVVKRKHSEWRPCCCFTWHVTQLLAVDVLGTPTSERAKRPVPVSRYQLLCGRFPPQCVTARPAVVTL